MIDTSNATASNGEPSHVENYAREWSPATHNGECRIVNRRTGGTVRVRIHRQPATAKFLPRSRLLEVWNPELSAVGDWVSIGSIHPLGTAHDSRTGEPVVSLVLFSRFRRYGEHDRSGDGYWVRLANVAMHPERFRGRGVDYFAETTCRCCNRRLTDPESVVHGVGPECARANGLQGERAAMLAAYRVNRSTEDGSSP